MNTFKFDYLRALAIPRFTSFQVAVTLSLVGHAALLFHFSPLSKNFPLSIAPIHDFHIPVLVELVGSVETSKTTSESENTAYDFKKESIQEEAKTFFSKNKINDGPISRVEKLSKAGPPIKPDLPFHKNQLVSFTKAPSSSAKSWNRAPVYPESARRLGREGRVILDAQLNDAGKVVSVAVSRSSGSADLDQAAIEAVREWTMDLPKDGSRRLFIPITFRFNSNS